MSAKAAADDILATAASYRAMLDQIRDLRLKGKAAIEAATEADIAATAKTFIEALDAL